MLRHHDYTARSLVTHAMARARQLVIPFVSDMMDYVAVLAVCTVAFLVSVLYKRRSLKTTPGAPPQVRGIPFFGSPDFFSRRWDFIVSNVKRHGPFFSFRLLQHRVYCVAGAEARKTYFSSPEHAVSFLQGYRVLFAGTPQLKDVKNYEPTFDFNGMLIKAISRTRMRDTMPQLIEDIYDSIKQWGDRGHIDPFNALYAIVFQLSCRMLGAKEIAENPQIVKKLTEFYWELEKGSGAVPVLLPWLPTFAKKRRQEATVGLYHMIVSIMQKRRDENRRENDTLQILMDNGRSDPEVVQLIIGFFFAAIINTGIGSAWLLLHIANNPAWRIKILKEIEETVLAYKDAIPDEDIVEGQQYDPSKPLKYLPMSAWEAMPMMDLAIKEVLRLTVSGASLRRVLEPGVVINGFEIPVGSFMCHPLGITHLDETIYKNPHQFDPDRFLPPRSEGDSEALSFLGWGVGKHPCLGMKFAKLEMKGILAVLLTSYKFRLESENGELPMPNRNNLHTTRPCEPVSLAYEALKPHESIFGR